MRTISIHEAAGIDACACAMGCLLLMVAIGCGDGGASSATQTTTSDAPARARVEPDGEMPTVTLREKQEAGDDTTPVIAKRTLFHVHGTLRLAAGSKETPHPVVQIVRRQHGRDVIHNAANTEQKRQGDVLDFDCEIKAPPETGSFRIEAVEGKSVLGSSPLTME